MQKHIECLENRMGVAILVFIYLHRRKSFFKIFIKHHSFKAKILGFFFSLLSNTCSIWVKKSSQKIKRDLMRNCYSPSPLNGIFTPSNQCIQSSSSSPVGVFTVYNLMQEECPSEHPQNTSRFWVFTQRNKNLTFQILKQKLKDNLGIVLPLYLCTFHWTIIFAKGWLAFIFQTI